MQNKVIPSLIERLTRCRLGIDPSKDRSKDMGTLRAEISTVRKKLNEREAALIKKHVPLLREAAAAAVRRLNAKLVAAKVSKFRSGR